MAQDEQSEKLRTPRLVGSDNDELQFVCRSWSNPKEEYIQTISKRDGYVACTCPDAQCRGKYPHLLDLLEDKDGHVCKHVRALIAQYRKLLGGD